MADKQTTIDRAELLALLNAWLCRDLLDPVALAKLIGDTRKAVEHG
ncbi:MAG TPA: hypothetical protein VFL96_07805 [Acidobacteriaceae bacterium]|nr:hypothetical protein [Acidobacteriaceae bacterium]